MKNLLLVGDSIRAGYDKSVKKTLEGKANVYFPSENTRFSAYVLRYIQDYKKLAEGADIDVLHWNAGLWDCLRMFGEDPHTPLDFYAYYIDRICARIQKAYPNAKVIFATSTSVQSERMSESFKRYNEDIEAYNAAAVEIVTKYGQQVNDLYTLSTQLPPEAHSDAVHYYTPMGTEAFTNRVLSMVSPLLGLDKVPVYREELHTDAPVGI